MHNITEAEKKEILSGILNSPGFKDSKRYQELLKYLVDKSDKEESVKELEIAIDLFGKDANFDPNSNSQIRAYVSNLRKKLEHYYLTTEDLFTYKLEIPRGQYGVNYIHVDASDEKHPVNKRIIYYAGIAVLVLFICSLAYIVWNSSSENIISDSSENKNEVWKEFFEENSKPTTVVLGDYIFLSQKDKSSDRIFMRNTKINSEKDFLDFKKKDPEDYAAFEMLKFTYLRPSAPYGLMQILNIWGPSFNKLSVKLASELKWEDFEEHNVVFIGTFKTLYKLDTLLAKTNLKYSVEPSTLTIMNNLKDTLQTFDVDWLASNYQKDYSVLVKIPGTKNNSILLCLGFSEIGVLEAVKMASDPNIVPRFEKYLHKNITAEPLFFEMVTELEGIELTAFNSEIKYFNILNKEEEKKP